MLLTTLLRGCLAQPSRKWGKPAPSGNRRMKPLASVCCASKCREHPLNRQDRALQQPQRQEGDSFKCMYGVKSTQQLGVQDQHDIEPFGALSTNRISGAQHRLPLLSSYTDRGEGCVFRTKYCPLSDGESGSVQTVLTKAGSNGFGDFCSTFGTAQNEGFSALDCAVTRVLSAASQPSDENN